MVLIPVQWGKRWKLPMETPLKGTWDQTGSDIIHPREVMQIRYFKF